MVANLCGNSMQCGPVLYNKLKSLIGNYYLFIYTTIYSLHAIYFVCNQN